MKKNFGFTLLEMVVVLVMMGIVTSLALPGLQKMYDSVSASLERKDVAMAINRLALDVRQSGRPLTLENYPSDISKVPKTFSARLSELDVSLQFKEPLVITANGFCPYENIVSVIKGAQTYQLKLRAPDCRVVNE